MFISYRREDTRDLADQLFDALEKRNYDVFVDRFRIAVGVDFRQRILQELAHKSMAVFLESRHILDSDWTKHEIAIAKSSRIGVLALAPVFVVSATGGSARELFPRRTSAAN